MTRMFDTKKLKKKEIKLEDLSLVVSKENCSRWGFNNSNQTQYVEDEDLLERNSTRIKIELQLFKETDFKTIAEIHCTLYNPLFGFSPLDKENLIVQEIPSFHEIFDMHTAELGELAFTLTQDDKDMDCYNEDLLSDEDKNADLDGGDLSMLYIDSISIDPEYQNLDIDTGLLGNINEILFNQLDEHCHFAVICPEDFSYNKNEIKKLCEKCGFEPYRKSRYMIRKGMLLI